MIYLVGVICFGFGLIIGLSVALFVNIFTKPKRVVKDIHPLFKKSDLDIVGKSKINPL